MPVYIKGIAANFPLALAQLGPAVQKVHPLTAIFLGLFPKVSLVEYVPFFPPADLVPAGMALVRARGASCASLLLRQSSSGCSVQCTARSVHISSFRALYHGGWQAQRGKVTRLRSHTREGQMQHSVPGGLALKAEVSGGVWVQRDILEWAYRISDQKEGCLSPGLC